MTLCAFCLVEPAHPRDPYCSSPCARLDNGAEIPERMKLTQAQEARLERRLSTKPEPAPVREIFEENFVHVAPVSDDWPRCEEPVCGRRHPPRRSKKTGEQARFCSESCYQRSYHRDHRDEHLKKMKDRYRRARQREAVAV
jgi:hypothetical protein